MDDLFSNKLSEKQKSFKNAANETNEQFGDRYANVNQTIKSNLNDMQGYVDNKIFSGDLERNEQENNLDHSHDYVLLDIKRDVYKANQKVYKNIKKYGKAEPTEDDMKKKGSIVGFFHKFANQFVQEFKGKEKNYQMALYDVAREQNVHADKTTALELSRLLKYSESIYNVLDVKNEPSLFNKGSLFNQIAAKQLSGVKAADKEKKKKELFVHFRYDIVPFMKNYKTKWFFGTRYYNLDGKRLKAKNGELNPEDYNKALVEGLMLETDKSKVKDTKTLEKNRKKKAEVLTRITKELIEYGDKFDPKKMTDLYISNHIIELQEYYARLNAFQQLVIDNQWFFLGKESAGKIKGRPFKDINDSMDPSFSNLIRTHILEMRAPVSNFIEAHLRSHCLQSNAKFKNRKDYFRKEEKTPFVFVGEEIDEVDDVKLDKEVDLDEVSSSLNDVNERHERYASFGEEFSVVDMSKMSEEDKKEYEKRLAREVGNRDAGVTGQILTNRLGKIKYEQTRTLSKDLTFGLKKELDKLKDDAKKNVQTYNKSENEEKNKVPEIPYASMSAGNLDDMVLLDLQSVKQRIFSEKGSVMYMNFGPEIDHIYGKMYAAARLQAELSARRKAIDSKLGISRIRNLEKDIKAKKGTKLTRKSWQEEIDKQKKKNHTAMKFTCKNTFVRFAEDYLADERIKRAEKEFDEISKKIEYTKTEMEMCKKTIRFFINNPTEKRFEKNADLKLVENFLKKENLSYMFDVDKLDEFDEILDSALLDTEKDLQKEAGKDAVAQPIRKADRSYRGRAARIHQVRQRGRLLVDTNQALIMAKTKFATDEDMFRQLIKMKPEELKKFNYKGRIPMSTKEQKNQAIDNIQLLNMIAAKRGKFDPKFYNNKVQMVMLYQSYKKAKIIPENLSYGRFAADIKIKIELLSSWNNYVMGLFKNQGTHNYSYLDTDALEGMSVHSLELLKKNLEKKQKKFKEEADAVKATIKKNVNKKDSQVKDDEGNVFSIKSTATEEIDEDASIAYRLRKRKLDNCTNLIDAVKRQISMKISRDKFTEFSEEAYNHKMNELSREAEIEYAKEYVFPAADKTFLVLRDLSKTERIKTLQNHDMFKRIQGEVNKNKNYLKDDKNLEKEALGLVVRLREIKIGPELSDMAGRALDETNEPNPDDIFTLLKYVQTLGDVESVVMANPAWSSPEQLALKAYFDRPENKELMTELVNKDKILSPLWRALNIYLEAHGIVGVSNFSVSRDWEVFRESVEIEDISENDKAKKLEEESEKICDTSASKIWEWNSSLTKLKDNIKKADEMLSDDPTARLFKLVHEGGEKLDISKPNEWKKIFTSIRDKGYYNKKPAKGQEKETYWMKIAAEQILNFWPQSLEDFYIERLKLDTGKALETTFRKLTVENGTAFVEDTGHAAEISAVISKKESFAYSAVDMGRRRELDEALKHAGYNTHTFKYLFKDVEVNGAGQTVNDLSTSNRTENDQLADAFIHRNDKDSKALFNPTKEWQDSVVSFFKEAIDFQITSEMTDPEYIKKHFEYLYGKTRKFAALKELYEHERDILENPDVIKRKRLKPQQIAKIHNAFGPKTRSVYAMFFEMIEAYAHTYFVDKEGRFDMGLTAEEIYGKDGKAIDKEANQKKLFDVLNKRKDHFKRMSRRVNSEIDREKLAEKVSLSDDVSKTLNVIQVKGNERVIKLVQKKGFEGKISDINILLQSPELADYVKQYNKGIQMIESYEVQMKPLKDQLNSLFKQGKAGTKEYLDLNEKILSIEIGTVKHRAEVATAEDSILKYQKDNKKIYENYNECHNEDGTLNIFEKAEDGSEKLHLEKYLAYQTSVAKDCARIYRDLKGYFGNPQNVTEKTFTSEQIVKRFKRDEMADKMRDLRKIDLYLNLLEVDKEGFKSKNQDLMKSINSNISSLKKTQKAIKGTDELNVGLKKQLGTQIEEMAFAQDFIKEVLKDMDGGPKNPVQMIHDYVQLVFLTLKSYGVTDTGEIVEEQIKSKVDGKLSEQEIRDIAYDEADKIGDAHLELQHEINIRLGFEKKPEVAAKDSKKDKASKKKDSKNKDAKGKETKKKDARTKEIEKEAKKKGLKREINIDVDNVNFEVLDENLKKKE